MSGNDASQNIPTFTERLRQQFNFLAFAASVLTAFAEVALFRTRFGERYFQGAKTAAVIPVLLLFPLFWPRHSPGPVLLCLVLYLAMCATHRVSIFRRRLRGETGIHSLYNGVSRLEQRFPKVSEATLKSRHEPVVMFLMGLAALVVSPPLGWLFIWTSAAMAFHAKLIFAQDRGRELDLSDARIEGELLAGTFRGRACAASSASVVSIHRSQP